MIFISNSERDTHKIAAQLADKIIKNYPLERRASVIALEGELGAGKTTFVRGFAKALGIKTNIKSPTFNLMKEYNFYENKKKKKISGKLIHIDCYRVKDHRDLAILNLKSLFNSSPNVVLIEWPERISKILPRKLVRVHIDHIDHNKRKIKIM
jgi:tRNA threonylcarbamoyladenosine biosynthesis protein TsaE